MKILNPVFRSTAPQTPTTGKLPLTAAEAALYRLKPMAQTIQIDSGSSVFIVDLQ